jgi:hypothetical protein
MGATLCFGIGYLIGNNADGGENTYSRYRESAKLTAKRACLGINPANVFECVSTKYENAQETQRGIQELTAQKQSALAGIAGAILSLFALLTTVLGLIWIKGTLDATRLAAIAAQNSVSETKRIGEAQVRAYIIVKKSEFFSRMVNLA